MANLQFKTALTELWSTGIGRAGVILLCLLIVGSILVVFTYPADFGTAKWGNPTLWADYPKAVPPAWTNLLRKTKRPKHRIIEFHEPSSFSQTGRAYESIYRQTLKYTAGEAPSFLSLSVRNLEYARRPPVITASLTRPDGITVELSRESTSGPRKNEKPPYKRYDSEPFRKVIGSDPRLLETLQAGFESLYGTSFDSDIFEARPEKLVFFVPDADGKPQILQGEYTFVVQVLTNSEEDSVGSIRLVLGGSVYGIMGTDALGRDLALGLLFGLPVALLIGVATSTVSTLLGMTLGMISGYAGGKLDILIQRAADIVANIPVLPLLIFLVFIGGSKLWLILLVLVVFSWPGLTIMVRTMVLQLRTGQEVESSRALGASFFRIIFRHIFPHAASYILAQLVFFAPSAILAEAGLSFLGLGDPSIPTWGQILEYGFRTGAVFLGYWWWIIPPGLLIVLTAVTFMFLALGLEPVVDPRLRGKRSWRF